MCGAGLCLVAGWPVQLWGAGSGVWLVRPPLAVSCRLCVPFLFVREDVVVLHPFMDRGTERNMTSRSCVKVLGCGSKSEFRGLTQESFVRPKGVWVLSTLKSPL